MLHLVNEDKSVTRIALLTVGSIEKYTYLMGIISEKEQMPLEVSLQEEIKGFSCPFLSVKLYGNVKQTLEL